MRLLFTMDKRDYAPDAPLFIRPSARAVILRDGRVAMVHSRKYDYYKFPGGGIEPDESREEAVVREVREESGLIVRPESVRPYGLVHRVQKGEKGDTFVQDNYYYLCEADGEPGRQDLDDYEVEEGFHLVWADPREVIAVNREHPHGPKDQAMLEREARVLETLMREGYV